MNFLIFCLPFLCLVSLLVAVCWIGLRFFRLSPDAAPRTCMVVDPPADFPPFRLSALLAPGDRRLALWLAAALLLTGLAMGLTLALSAHITPPAPTGDDLGPVRDVRGILEEEVLGLPQPLPPALFSGTEGFDLEHADRDWGRLDRGFRAAVLQLFGRMEVRGYRMALVEGFRSAARQERLAQQGPGVTRARGGQSRHQHGLAADVAPLREGRLVISERDPWAAAAYRILGEESGKLGLVWGGAWTVRDLGHVEQAAHAGSPPSPPGS